MSDDERYALAIFFCLVGIGIGYRWGYRAGKNDLLNAFISAQRIRHTNY